MCLVCNPKLPVGFRLFNAPAETASALSVPSPLLPGCLCPATTAANVKSRLALALGPCASPYVPSSWETVRHATRDTVRDAPGNRPAPTECCATHDSVHRAIDFHCTTCSPAPQSTPICPNPSCSRHVKDEKVPASSQPASPSPLCDMISCPYRCLLRSTYRTLDALHCNDGGLRRTPVLTPGNLRGPARHLRLRVRIVAAQCTVVPSCARISQDVPGIRHMSKPSACTAHRSNRGTEGYERSPAPM